MLKEHSIKIKRWFLLVLILGPAPEYALSDDCIKKVFGTYCLGGTYAEQPSEARFYLERGFIFSTKDERGRTVYVKGTDGRVSRVARIEERAGLGLYKRVKNRLEEIYGEPAHHVNTLLDWFRSDIEINAAIKAGYGIIMTQWNTNEYDVVWKWSEGDMSLLYIYRELEAKKEILQDDYNDL